MSTITQKELQKIADWLLESHQDECCKECGYDSDTAMDDARDMMQMARIGVV